MREFSEQSLKESESEEAEITAFMKGLDEEKKRCELQLNFVSAIVLPLWRGMAKNYPKCIRRVQRAEDIWKNYKQKLKELNASNPNGGNGDHT